MLVYKKFFFVLLLLLILGSNYTLAQAPDCSECDPFIDDPIAYAECVEANCGDAGIPIDDHLWVLVVAGIGLYFYISKRERLSIESKNI